MQIKQRHGHNIVRQHFQCLNRRLGPGLNNPWYLTLINLTGKVGCQSNFCRLNIKQEGVFICTNASPLYVTCINIIYVINYYYYYLKKLLIYLFKIVVS